MTRTAWCCTRSGAGSRGINDQPTSAEHPDIAGPLRAGTKRESYEMSRKGAGKLCRAVCSAKADRFASDCMLAGLNVTEETGIASVHPIEVLRDAYGLKEQRRLAVGE